MTELSPDAEARALAAWSEHDASRAIHARDREAIRTTEAARALVLALFASAPLASRRVDPARDLYSACALLGRLLFEAGASPSLAVSTIDGAAIALEKLAVSYDPARLAAARGSVAEGYFASLSENERARARHAWEYPACAVRLEDGLAAIACGLPDDDEEALGDWAARVALAASKDGVRRVVASGSTRARAELASALELVGITLVTPGGAAAETPKKASWLRLPFWHKT